MNDNALRTLFQKAGHEQAPDGLHAAIMEQVMAADTAPVVKPLIAPRQWMLIGVAMTAITALVWFLSTTVPGVAASGLTSTFHVDLGPIGQALQSFKWIAMAMGFAFVLTVMDRLLSQGQHRTSH